MFFEFLKFSGKLGISGIRVRVQTIVPVPDRVRVRVRTPIPEVGYGYGLRYPAQACSRHRKNAYDIRNQHIKIDKNG